MSAVCFFCGQSNPVKPFFISPTNVIVLFCFFSAQKECSPSVCGGRSRGRQVGRVPIESSIDHSGDSSDPIGCAYHVLALPRYRRLSRISCPFLFGNVDGVRVCVCVCVCLKMKLIPLLPLPLATTGRLLFCSRTRKSQKKRMSPAAPIDRRPTRNERQK